MIAFFLALAIPEDVRSIAASDFLVSNYWRVIFAVPIILGII